MQDMCKQLADNIRVLECPAKLVRRLIRRLSGDSIGVSFSSSLYRIPTVATDPVPTSSIHSVSRIQFIYTIGHT